MSLHGSFIGHYVSASMLCSVVPELAGWQSATRFLFPRWANTSCNANSISDSTLWSRPFHVLVYLGSEVAIKTNPTTTDKVTTSDKCGGNSSPCFAFWLQEEQVFHHSSKTMYFYFSDSGLSGPTPTECEGNCSCGRGQMSALSRWSVPAFFRL